MEVCVWCVEVCLFGGGVCVCGGVCGRGVCGGGVCVCGGVGSWCLYMYMWLCVCVNAKPCLQKKARVLSQE